MMGGRTAASTGGLRVVGALLSATVACAPAERPANTVVFASGADLESANPLVTIHPLARQVQRFALFVTLTRPDSALAPRPYAARSWHWSDDHKVLTFRLEPTLRWHDGKRTTARDVTFTLDAARDPATGYPRYGDLAAIERVTTVDDSTVELRFARPQVELLQVLSELPILPAHLLALVPRSEMRRASFNLAPVGNGPFRFAGRRAGERWLFERNADFPQALGGAPKLERLVIAVVDEATTKFAGLVSGELDVAGIAPTMASLVARDRRLRVLTYPVLFSTAIVLNTARPPFDDPRVRKAMDLAIDRTRIIAAALAGFAEPAAGPVSPENPLADRGAPVLDPRRADSLLDAAGWRRGADGRRRRGDRLLAFELLTVGSADNAVEQLIQADLAARGIEMRIRQLELGAFLAEARATPSRFDALLTGIPGDLSLAYLAGMYDSRLAGGALDYGGFHSAALDALFDRARAAPDAEAMHAAWVDVQRALSRDLPAVWLYHSRGVQGVSRRLRNVSMDLRGELATVHDWTTAPEPATVARR
jgi:peptide/nickel transport system substrate-binding protein